MSESIERASDVGDRRVTDAFERLRIYIEALSDAATRCRRVLVVIAIASIVFFIAFWNSRETAWLSLRVGMAQDCLRLEAYREDGLAPNNKADRRRYNECWDYIDHRGLFADGLSDEDRRLLLQEERASYSELRRKSVVVVTVPFFLTVFDVNDLGTIAGISFFLLLIGYVFSTIRERDTMRHAFDDCRDAFGNRVGSARDIYSILSSSQVLIVPAFGNGEEVSGWRDRIQRWVSKVLFWPPLFVQLCIVSNDFATLEGGTFLSQRQAQNAVVVESVLLLGVLALTIIGTMVSWQITREWDKEYLAVVDSEKLENEEGAPVEQIIEETAVQHEQSRPKRRRSRKRPDG